jgi:hypothetical protein
MFKQQKLLQWQGKNFDFICNQIRLACRPWRATASSLLLERKSVAVSELEQAVWASSSGGFFAGWE